MRDLTERYEGTFYRERTMNILQSIQSILEGSSGSGTGEKAGAALDSLSGMLKSGAMGDVARNIFTNRKGDFSWLKTAVIAGAGSMLWKRLSQRVAEANAAENPQYGRVASNPEDKAERTIRALIFAAKADGHIDDREKAVINKKIDSMNLGAAGRSLVRQALSEPLDARLVTRGVNDSEEALGLYTMSRAVIDPDNATEKAYLNSLASALRIPGDVRDQVDQQIRMAQTGMAQTAGY